MSEELSDKSPKIQKSKRKQKRDKKKALQNFLQKSDISLPIDLFSANHSDHEQNKNQIQHTYCTICKIQLDYRKYCGFCHEYFCIDHLRKKRKNKQTSKFQKICDYCQDRYLFNKYMKLQLKNQQSLATQEMIMQSKKNQIQMQFNGRTTKLKLLEHDKRQIQAERKQFQLKISKQQNDLKIKLQRLDKKYKQLINLQKQIQQLQLKLPPSFQQDFHQLELENNKVNLDLLKFQKLCSQAIKMKSKRQKQIYDQYHQWERIQKDKRNKKNQDCLIF